MIATHEARAMPDAAGSVIDNRATAFVHQVLSQKASATASVPSLHASRAGSATAAAAGAAGQSRRHASVGTSFV